MENENKRVFEVRGYSSYSNYFGWSTPMEYFIEKEVSFSDVEEIEERANGKGCFAGSYSGINRKSNVGDYGYCFHNSHGGTTTENGFIVASSKEEASLFIKEMNKYKEVEFYLNEGYKFSSYKELQTILEHNKAYDLTSRSYNEVLSFRKRLEREKRQRVEEERGFSLSQKIDIRSIK